MTGTVNAWRSAPANVSAHLDACSELCGLRGDIDFMAKKSASFFFKQQFRVFHCFDPSRLF